METIKVKLIRPLDGMPIGSEVDYPAEDARRLERGGVVAFLDAKAAPSASNKKAPPVQNKAASARRKAR